jgi:heme A synthase
MSVINLFITLFLVGTALWLIENRIRMERQFKIMLNAAIAIFLILWVQVAFGIIGPVSNVNIGSINLR